MPISFNKHYNSPTQIIKLLQNRGLAINDTTAAIQDLINFGYYRFSAYLYPLLANPKDAHIYKPQSKFETAVSLYMFDQELRSLAFKEIAKIEVAVRSSLANIATKETGNMFWMTEVSTYKSQNIFLRTMTIIDKELKGSKEDFIKHFKHKYSNPYPPAWMLVEILPMGALNHIYSNIADNTLRKKIAAHFSLTVPVFSSWMTTIILTRNACCHHARVWNKENAIPPVVPRKTTMPWISFAPTTRRFYFNLCIIKYFINQIYNKNELTTKLKDLLSAYPLIDKNAMGFPSKWEDEPLWK